MKRLTLNLLIYTLVFLLASCSQETPKYRIGISQCAEGLWRDQMNEEIRREALMHDNLELQFKISKDNAQQQIADIEELLASGIDALIVSPTNSHDLVPVIEKVYDKGIPVVLVDRKIESEKYTVFAGADNRGVGKTAAEMIMTQVKPDAFIIEVQGDMASSPVRERHEGFAAELEKYGYQATCLDTHWDLGKVEQMLDSVLNMGVIPDAVFCHNDFLAVRVGRMFKDIREHSLLIGVDALPTEGVQYILDDEISGSVEYPTCGIPALHTVLKILQGEPAERYSKVPSSPVDKQSAEIIQSTYMRNAYLADEINTLSGKVNQFLMRFNLQQLLLGTSLLFIVILTVMFTILVREYRQVRSLNQKIKSLSEARISFFTNVSHDFRTPLTLISDPIRQLQALLPVGTQEAKLIDLASKNVTVLLKLINQVLDFRKFEEGKMELQLTEFDLHERLTEWTDVFIPLAEKRQIAFSVSCPEDLYMLADPEKLERLTYNVLSNSFKYTPDGGSVSVRIEPQGTEQVLIAFADSGKGMSDKELGHIFENFYQTNVHYAGTGIGMALIKAFVDMHKGTIQVKSQPNQGTTVTICLPLRQAGVATLDTERSQVMQNVQESALLTASQSVYVEQPNLESQDSRKSILIIDDTADVRQYIHMLLQNTFTVYQAANGGDGIEQAFQQIPDLIILDVAMPDISGIEVAKQLKSDLRTSHIPILMLTASTADETQIAGFQSGADAFMQKPFNSQVLQARIDNLLAATAQRQQHFSQTAVQTNPVDVEAESTDGLSVQDAQFVEQLRSYLIKHLNDSNLRMEDLGSQMALSYTQLYRKTKSLIGMGPTELLRSIRLERAKELLLTSNMPITEITYSVGFTSPSYFTKCYREHFGITPSEQREAEKQ